jgi:hypothetical protein
MPTLMLLFLNAVVTWIVFLASPSVALSAPDVFVLHNPIQPGALRAVSYSATATDPTGVTLIIISEQQEELKLCANGQHTCFDIRSPWRNIQTCTFSNPLNTAPCSAEVSSGYPNHYRIRYRAQATNVSGQTTTEGEIYFAAGDYNWPNDPIPIYVRGDPDLKIDLVFIPDKDYGPNNTGFMNDVTTLLRDSFLSDQPFSKEIRARRDMWNFYVTYQQGDALSNPCRQLRPPNWTLMRATVDSGFVVHKTPFGDCSGIGPGTTFSGEPINAADRSSFVVPVHETGHSVFSLADEWGGATHGMLFDGTLPEHNVFSTRTKCQQNAQLPSHGWNPADCTLIDGTTWWRSDSGGDLMVDTSTVINTPGRSDAGRYHWWYAQCAAGNC